MTFDFHDRTLFVTGATGGIGAAVATLFAAAGANVFLTDRAPSVAGNAAALGPRALGHALDVADSEACRAAAEACADRFGAIDFVVASAGIYRDEPIAEMSPAAWRATLAVNLDGVFNTVAAALPHLTEASSIVTITSMAAHMGGSFGHAHYGASKGGVLALTRSLARELGPRTRANAVSPGVIATGMTERLIGTRGDAVLAQTPLARHGTPAEIASVVAFLCSPAAAFVTGEAIHVNGGLYMGG